MLEFHDYIMLGIANTSAAFKDSQSRLDFTGNGAFSDEVAHYIILINLVYLCTIISVFGIFSNVINLLVLKQQGFQETVNITLFATSLSDLISEITTLWVAVCYNPLMISADIPFRPLEIQFLTGEMPHVIAMNATSWLTAYVTLERCLCIAFPLSVKEMITTWRTKVVIVFIFAMVTVSQVPTYWINRMAWKFDPERNQTVLGVVPTTKGQQIFDSVTLYIVNVIGPFLSFTAIIVCSTILVVKLSQKSQWRLRTKAASGREEEMTIRDRKVMKMILTVAMIFITTFTPAIVIFCFTANDSRYLPTGSLANNYYVAVSFAYVFESVNASVNIFVYYNMSSKYKAIFRSIFFAESVRA